MHSIKKYSPIILCFIFIFGIDWSFSIPLGSEMLGKLITNNMRDSTDKHDPELIRNFQVNISEEINVKIESSDHIPATITREEIVLNDEIFTGVSMLGVLPKPDHDLHIYALPLGNGDGTIIQCPYGDIIIIDLGHVGDSGWTANMVKTYLQYQLFQVTSIIVSRGSESHYNLLPYIFDRNAYFPNLRRIILGGRQQDYSNRNFTSWINRHRQVVEYVNNQEPCISDCVFDPLTCMNTQAVTFGVLGANLGSNAGGRSIINFIQTTTPNFKLVLPGDFEGTDIEKLIVQEWEQARIPVNCTHYKISSNGYSSNSNSIAFINALQPSYAFATNAYPSDKGSFLTCAATQNLLLSGSIKKRKYGGTFACGSRETYQISQYLNWVYEVYTTAPYPGSYDLIHVRVPLPRN